jgi:SGNH hydrolase-like domain, acetyltransferase AlgX
MSEPSSVEVVSLVKPADIAARGRGDVRVEFARNALSVQGWVVGTDSAAVEVQLVEDGHRRLAAGPVNMPRPDLVPAVVDVAIGARAGFRLVLEVRGSGESLLEVRVAFADGGAASLAELRLSITSPAGVGKWGWPRLRIGRSLSWKVLSISGEAEKVLEGRNGWLFLRADSNDVIGQHTGKVKLSGASLQAWKAVLERRRAQAEALGVRWLCVVLPDKESVYPEQLPGDIRPASTRPVHDLLAAAHRSGVPLHYALSELLEAKSGGVLYPKTDTHWSHRGAYVVYRWVCEQLDAGGIPVCVCEGGDISWDEEELPGDLGIKVYPGPARSPMAQARLARHHGRVVYDNGLRNHGRVLIFEREDLPGGATCVVFGESFIENLLVFLKETFRRLVVVHTNMFIREVLEAENPDVVLSFPLERFLMRVPEDSDALARLAATAKEKGGAIPWAVDGGEASPVRIERPAASR